MIPLEISMRRRALALVLMCTIGACGGDDDGAEPFVFEEMRDQGLMRYVGVAQPVRSFGVGTSIVHEFDVEDGPICLRGAPYRVATRRAAASDDSANLVIYLQGGGACSSRICQVTNATTDTVLENGVPAAGILSPTLSANPLRDWNVTYAPYCDGSLMSGDVEADDDGDGNLDRFQKGLRNLSAALDLALAEFPSPRRIVLTGISAGGYATMTAVPIVRFHYPNAEILVVNDAGVGIASGEEGSLEALAAEWGSTSAIPASCEECFAENQLMPVIGWQLDRDPNLKVGIISSKRDSVIAATFVMIPGERFETVLFEQSGRLREAHPDCFNRFIFEGSRHTTLAIESDTDLSAAVNFTDIDPDFLDMILGRFDVTEIGGVTVAEWVTSMIDGDGWDDRVAGE